MRYPSYACFTHSFKSDISGRNHVGRSIPWRFSAFGDPEKLLSIEVPKAKKKTDSFLKLRNRFKMNELS